jgi:RNA polymerase-binding transcription factor
MAIKRKTAPRSGSAKALRASAKKTVLKPVGRKPAKPAARTPARGAAKPKAGPAKPAVGAVKPAAKRGDARPAAVVRPLPRPPVRRPQVALVARPKPEPPPVPPDPKARPLTPEDFKDFEERLLNERSRVLKEMGHLESTILKSNQRDSAGDLSGYTFHMADLGTDAMEREKAFLFASAEGRLLLEIDEALRRLYQGKYGICESCGNPIARARLEAVPTARLCVVCKGREERAARGAL